MSRTWTATSPPQLGRNRELTEPKSESVESGKYYPPVEGRKRGKRCRVGSRFEEIASSPEPAGTLIGNGTAAVRKRHEYRHRKILP